MKKAVRSLLLMCAFSAVASSLACSSTDTKKSDASATGGSGGGGGSSGSGGTGGSGSGGTGGVAGTGGGTGGASGSGGSGTGGTGGAGGRDGAAGSGGTGGAADGGRLDVAAADMGGGGGGMFAVTAPWAEGGMIDPMYKCTMNRTPIISWTAGPAGTLSYAMVFFDRTIDRIHLAMVNIPGTTRSLPPVPTGVQVAPANGVTNTTWAGPCPPANGGPHIYDLTIYAMRTAAVAPGANADATRTALESMTNADVLARARVSGVATP